MIGLLLLGLMVVGGFWLFFSVIGLIFKLAFVLVGGVFTLVGGLLGSLIAMSVAGVLAMVLLPILGLLMLPLLMPLLLVAGAIWLLTHNHCPRPIVIVQAR